MVKMGNFIFSYRVYLCKQWTDLRVFNDHTAMATGIRFGSNASYLASTSMDRTLKIYGPWEVYIFLGIFSFEICRVAARLVYLNFYELLQF